MAEIDSSGGGGKKGKKVRSKKMSTKIDMTPMVDLGFLLITFFMLTTTLSKPQAMELNMPDQDKDKPKQTQETPASKSLTVMLDEFNRVFWYKGVPKDNPEVVLTDFSPTGIRKTLLEKRREIGEDFVVLIKATKKAKYKNVVDILDEMAITNTVRYAIVAISPIENTMIQKKKDADGIK